MWPFLNFPMTTLPLKRIGYSENIFFKSGTYMFPALISTSNQFVNPASHTVRYNHCHWDLCFHVSYTQQHLLIHFLFMSIDGNIFTVSVCPLCVWWVKVMCAAISSGHFLMWKYDVMVHTHSIGVIFLCVAASTLRSVYNGKFY